MSFRHVCRSIVRPPVSRFFTVSATFPTDVKHRIRDCMVRHVLLAPEPLTVQNLVDLVEETHAAGEASSELSVTSESGGFAHRGKHPTSPQEEQISEEAGAKDDGMGYHVGCLSDLLLSGSLAREAAHLQGENRANNLESLVRLLLAVDPEFRVSRAGFVCYPNLPSLFTASTNMGSDGLLMRKMRSFIRKGEEAAEYRRQGGLSKSNCSSSGSSLVEKEPELCRWSYVMSLCCMLDSFSDAVEGETSRQVGGICETPLTKRKNYGKEESVSQRLVNLWIEKCGVKKLPALICEGSSLQEERHAICCSELREHMEGNDVLRRWCTETREGYINELLSSKSFLGPSAKSLLQQVNAHVAYLFNLIVAVPITLGRLSSLIQWETFPFAAQYRSLLHFTILFTGCPAVLQMERYETRRREAQKQWRSLLWENVHEEWDKQRHAQLSRRFASHSAIEEELEEPAQATKGLLNNTAEPHYDTTLLTSGKRGQYHFWVSSTSGPAVSPKLLDVCRCVFMQPLEDMALLDVTTRSPSEVMDALVSQGTKGVGEAVDTMNDFVVFATTPFVLEHRICRVVRRWWLLEGQHQTQGNADKAVITVERLSRLCLWEHEYGTETASRMMLHYLQSLEFTEETIQLLPPAACPLATEGAGRWRVVVPMTVRK
uniref:WGS project CAEQ00000000 data, annotated contig 1152 n=1 Tax=Trypanosoma congolense (strain IL3000) TaxID=1068625 RepID=F9W467_TRYCI|nr:unnamed protein product [Trypanosoma congolense IL3000]